MILFFVLSFWVNSVFSQTQKCEAVYDHLGIPQIKVINEKDYYYCFGYHHGKDRAWMMDFFRRSVHGTNAEVLGMDHLKNDLMMRLLDIPSIASSIWDNYPAEEKEKLQNYTDGVNEGFKLGKNSPEFISAKYLPDSWKPVNTIEVLLLQSFDQTRKTFYTDYEQEKSKERWKDKAAGLMTNDNIPWENTILKKGEYDPSEEVTQSVNSTEVKNISLWARFPQIFGEEAGSNNWVVASKKSKSGKALLANDPHLDLKTPLFWHWINLKTPIGAIVGASLPGVPLIVSGTNGDVAWGLTNSYINTADAVFVDDVPEGEVESFRPVVWVKLGFLKLPFFFKSFERTKSGHRVLPLETENKKRIFLRWSGFHLVPEEIYSMFELMGVENVSDADDVLKKVGLPSWNFVFADTEGEIGFRTIGKAYRHLGATQFGIGSLTWKEFQNPEYLNSEEIPNLMNPDRGYIYTANNRHWPEDAKFNGGRGYSPSFRGYRIDELLRGSDHDIESFKSIQCDRMAVDAKFFVPKILSQIDFPEIKDWNFLAHVNLTAPSYYRRFMDLLMQKWEVNEYGLIRLLDEVTPEMKKEMLEVYSEAKKDVSNRPWGEIHKLSFPHLSNNADWKYSPVISTPGDNQSIDPGTARWNSEKRVYEHYSGASMRMIVEMDATPKVYLVLPGLNLDYDKESKENVWENWRDCRYTEINFN